MRRIIHHLRRQPEELRRQILYIFVFLAGIILVSLWVWSLGSSSNETEIETGTDRAANPNPFSVIKDNLALPEW